jgi:hypothetical protein
MSKTTETASTSPAKKGDILLFALAGLCFVIALGVMGYWVSEGSHFVTQYEVPVEVTEVLEDEFGDEIETTRTVFKEDFRFGLMPDERGFDGAAPLAGGAAFLGLIFLALAWFRRRRPEESV